MTQQIVFIKRVEDDGHDDHHGGGWKVAYADFMTAMMAFFLLLWILAASDEEKLRGLADYFTPSLSEAGGRGQGMLAGQVLAEDGNLSGTDGPESEERLPSFGQENPLAVFDSRIRYDEKYASAASPEPGGSNAEEGGISQGGSDTAEEWSVMGDPTDDTTTSVENTTDHDVETSLAKIIEGETIRESALEEVREAIERKIAATPEIADLRDNLKFELTNEGLEIQIIDGKGESMFEIGSARIAGRAEGLIRAVADAIAPKLWPIAISGHTDSLSYANGAEYSNWELSADRANATRRVLQEQGVAASRVQRVNAFADSRPLLNSTSDAPENRRIGILLIYPAVLPGPMRVIEAEIGQQ